MMPSRRSRSKCGANVAASGGPASPGELRSTNSNGRPAVPTVKGGVSQRYAENGDFAKSEMKKARKSSLSCHSRSVSPNETVCCSESRRTCVCGRSGFQSSHQTWSRWPWSNSSWQTLSVGWGWCDQTTGSNKPYELVYNECHFTVSTTASSA